MPRDRIALVLALGLALTAAAASAREVSKEYHESFEAVSGAVLHLEHGDGDVVVTPWSRDVIDVKVVYHVSYKKIGTGGEPALTVDFSRDGNEIRVAGREKVMSGVNIFFITNNYRYEYMVRAPAGVRLELVGDDGDVEIEGWRADIDCTLDDGDVVLQDIRADRVSVVMEDGDLRATDLQGDLDIRAEDGELMLVDVAAPHCRLRSDDGEISVRKCRGNFEIHLEDGYAELLRVTAPTLLLRGGDGDVVLDLLPAADIDWDVEMEDGDVCLDLPSGLSAAVDLATDCGDIDLSDLPDGVSFHKDDGTARGTLGDGEGRIRIRTDDGDIALRGSP